MTNYLDQREALAAEYVLGTLDPTERARAEIERDRDPVFAQLIDDWSAKLSPLSEAVGAVAPPTGAWKSIETSIAARSRPVVEDVPRQEPVRTPLLQRLSFWRTSTAGALALAAYMAFYIVSVDIIEAEPPSRYVALLDNIDGDLAWLLTIDTDAQTLNAVPVSDVAVDEKDLQLWMIKDADTAVLSAGLLHPTDPKELRLEEAALEEGRLLAAAYAVSVEPPGGSPTGLPTGPMLYQGGVYPVQTVVED